MTLITFFMYYCKSIDAVDDSEGVENSQLLSAKKGGWNGEMNDELC